VSVHARVHEDAHLLLWQVHGAADLVLDGEIVALPAGSACWIPAGVVHSLAVRSDSVVLPLFFDAAATRSPAAGCTVLRIPEELRPLLMLSMQYQNSIIATPEGREQLEAQLMDLIRSRSALPLPVSEPARSIAEALRRDPADPRTAQDLAADAHVSYRTLERAFLQETGMTLHQWRITGRMQAATRLLREGVCIPAVAARVGYANVSAFGRVFKEQVGETPRRYALHHGASI
jgi:AraC-like DNA-binding protein